MDRALLWAYSLYDDDFLNVRTFCKSLVRGLFERHHVTAPPAAVSRD